MAIREHAASEHAFHFIVGSPREAGLRIGRQIAAHERTCRRVDLDPAASQVSRVVGTVRTVRRVAADQPVRITISRPRSAIAR